jgi:D-alanyl-D-alanine carboxypeptidase
MLNSRDPNLLKPFVKELLVDFLVVLDLEVAAGTMNHYVLAQTVRDIEYQNYLYAQGRTRPGRIVTNARGGKSHHHFGVAVDILLLSGKDILHDTHPDWDRMGALGQEACAVRRRVGHRQRGQRL